MTGTTGGANIAATEAPHADGEAFGITVTVAGVSVGVAVSKAIVSGNTVSYLADHTVVHGPSLTVSATQKLDAANDPSALATAKLAVHDAMWVPGPQRPGCRHAGVRASNRRAGNRQHRCRHPAQRPVRDAR